MYRCTHFVFSCVIKVMFRRGLEILFNE
uniref:Uncharacterized protein n=1 Tax=Anguilla anguilla TaxID=7936 RepID=A0A0E9WCB8_ANGAN